MKISILLIGILVIISLTGCASPGVHYQYNKEANFIEITPVKKEGFFVWLASLFGGSGLPAGKYDCQFEENVKAGFDSKKDIKLIELDMNANKVGT